MTLSEWLRERMRSRGWTQNELARVLGVSPMQMSDIIRKNHFPGDKILQQISDRLHISMGYLHYLGGYSWMEKESVREKATQLAELMKESPIIGDLWQEIDRANEGTLQEVLNYIRYLNSR